MLRVRRAIVSVSDKRGLDDLGRALAGLRRPAVIYDCWRLLDEETVRGAGVRYAGIGYG